MIRGRLRRGGGADAGEAEVVDIDPAELTGVFNAPGWLRDAGFSAWLLVGVALLAVAVVSLLSITYVIVAPLIVGGVIAAVASPLVDWAAAHRVPRALGAALILVLIVALGALAAYLIFVGIASQTAA